MIAHIYPSVLQAVAGRGYAGRLEGSIPGYRGGAIQDLGYEFPRIRIPRTPVNKPSEPRVLCSAELPIVHLKGSWMNTKSAYV